MEIKLSEQEIHNFLEIIGPVKGKKALEVLERVIPGVQAVYATDYGIKMIKSAVERFLVLFEKNVDMKLDELEKGEYFFLKDVYLPREIGSLKLYLNIVGKIKAAGER